jgi:F0F1-type ATP synthase membrane subunit b/b'
MATKSSKATSSKPKTKAKSAPTSTPAPSRVEQVRSAAERAVDLPVGAMLEASDRVAELVEPFSGRTAAEKQLKSYGTRLRRTVKRTERRGASARRKASAEARKTRNKVEREARKRQRRVETTLKRNRTEVEQRVRRAIEDQTSRAQDLVDQVGDQLSALR